MSEIFDLLDDLLSEDAITPVAHRKLKIGIALLRPHAASPRSDSQSPPLTGDRSEDGGYIYVCGKCGTHYLDHY